MCAAARIRPTDYQNRLAPMRSMAQLYSTFPAEWVKALVNLACFARNAGFCALVDTTARYAHLANESLKASCSRVIDSIAMHIAPSETASSSLPVAQPRPATPSPAPLHCATGLAKTPPML